jgi:hypothetical protein
MLRHVTDAPPLGEEKSSEEEFVSDGWAACAAVALGPLLEPLRNRGLGQRV